MHPLIQSLPHFLSIQLGGKRNSSPCFRSSIKTLSDPCFFLKFSSTESEGAQWETLTSIAGKSLCAVVGGKIITEGSSHVSWVLLSFNTVIFHWTHVCYRVEHNTIAEPFGAMTTGISHKDWEPQTLLEEEQFISAQTVSCLPVA